MIHYIFLCGIIILLLIIITVLYEDIEYKERKLDTLRKLYSDLVERYVNLEERETSNHDEYKPKK